MRERYDEVGDQPSPAADSLQWPKTAADDCQRADDGLEHLDQQFLADIPSAWRTLSFPVFSSASFASESISRLTYSAPVILSAARVTPLARDEAADTRMNWRATAGLDR